MTIEAHETSNFRRISYGMVGVAKVPLLEQYIVLRLALMTVLSWLKL